MGFWAVRQAFIKKTARFLLPALMVILPPVNAQDYETRRFGAGEGMEQPYVYTICQDSLGNLWTGTAGGILVYDGFVFRGNTSENNLQDNLVTCSGRYGSELWFGHGNGKVSMWDGKGFTGMEIEGSDSSRITCISRSPSGEIWLSSFTGGLFRFNRNRQKFENMLACGGDQVNTFIHINDNTILVGTGSGLRLCNLDYKGRLQGNLLLEAFPQSRVSRIIKTRRENSYLAATENDGIFLLKPDARSALTAALIIGPAEVNNMQDICEDVRSDLWVASFGEGVKKFNLNRGKYEQQVAGTSVLTASANARTVFEDREGIIWIGTYGEGLAAIIPKPFMNIIPEERYGSNILSVYSYGEFRWLGTGRGLIKTDIHTGKTVAFYGSDNGLPDDSVTAIFTLNGDDFWIGTGSNGLFRLSATGRISAISTGEGNLENTITAITGNGNTLHIGTGKGLIIYNIADGSMARYSISQGGLPHNFINGLHSDRNGRIWVTTRSKNLSFIDNGKVVRLPVNLGSGLSVPGPVAEDSVMRIWIGSSGSGIFIAGEDSIINITAGEGLLSDYCYSVLADRQYIWAAHKNGLTRIDMTDFSMKQVTSFPGNHEEIHFNPNAAFREASGRIVFGSNKGLIIYDPAAEFPYAVPPLLSVKKITINDQEVTSTGNSLNLPPGRYRMRIEYLGSSLRDPEHVRYQSIMQGYDDYWSEITPGRSVSWPNLTYGRYSFVLKASSADGIVTPEPLTFNVIIKMPLWRKWWFYPALIVMWTIIVLLFIRYRSRRLIQEKRILEEKVRERTQEIEFQKDELEKQRDEISEKNTSITSSIRYARHIQKALLPPNEVLARALPDSFIMHRPKDIVSGDFYWVSERDGKIIFAVADCTGHGVPGAFMSLLGITLLNEIVNINGITRSDHILNELRDKVIKSLQQNRKEATTLDGMDIALCVFDKNKMKLQFTGGMNDLVIIRNGKLEVIKSDHLDVSVSYSEFGSFRLNELECSRGDMVYLFSDGYQDQFGGQFDKKFLRPHFYTTLVEVHRYPVLNQKEMLERKLLSWMRHHPQTDDITVMGVRI